MTEELRLENARLVLENDRLQRKAEWAQMSEQSRRRHARKGIEHFRRQDYEKALYCFDRCANSGLEAPENYHAALDKKEK